MTAVSSRRIDLGRLGACWRQAHGVGDDEGGPGPFRHGALVSAQARSAARSTDRDRALELQPSSRPLATMSAARGVRGIFGRLGDSLASAPGCPPTRCGRSPERLPTSRSRGAVRPVGRRHAANLARTRAGRYLYAIGTTRRRRGCRASGSLANGIRVRDRRSLAALAGIVHARSSSGDPNDAWRTSSTRSRRRHRRNEPLGRSRNGWRHARRRVISESSTTSWG